MRPASLTIWTFSCLASVIVTLTIVITACQSDHDLLAPSNSTTASSGGSGGTSASTATAMGFGGQTGIVEPNGPTKLTLVNGVVDTDAVNVCLVPYPDPASSTTEPWPNTTDGLPFAHALHADNIEGMVPANSDVEVYVLTGDLQQASGKNCSQLIDTPPTALSVRSLGVLPASAFEEPKSILLVLNGCIGGATHTGPLETAACGANYTPTQATVSLIAGFMSRINDAETVSLQFVHAVAGMAAASVHLTPGLGNATPVPVLNGWTLGAIAPFPPYQQLAQSSLGIADSTVLELYPNSEAEALAPISWSTAFQQGTASSDDVINGANVIFVAVGAAPGATGEDWFHELTWTALTPDP